MTARNRAMSLSSSSSVLNLTENSNLGSIIWPKGFLRLLRNSRVMKICPYDMRVPSLFIRGAIMMIKISITPYFSKVTCKRQERTDVMGRIVTYVLNSQKSTAKPSQRFMKDVELQKYMSCFSPGRWDPGRRILGYFWQTQSLLSLLQLTATDSCWRNAAPQHRKRYSQSLGTPPWDLKSGDVQKH